MSETHRVMENAARRLRTMVAVARVIVRKGGEGSAVVAAEVDAAERAAEDLERRAAEVRPSPAAVAWSRGEREAQKYHGRRPTCRADEGNP